MFNSLNLKFESFVSWGKEVGGDLALAFALDVGMMCGNGKCQICGAIGAQSF